MLTNRKARAYMCKKLKEIHGLEPNEILKKYLAPNEGSINVKELLQKMKIRCEAADFVSLEKSLILKEFDAVLGMAVSSNDDLCVLYSDKLDCVTANYVLAHELAHCCLHLPVSAEFHVEMKTQNDIYSVSGSNTIFRLLRTKGKSIGAEEKENEADAFAADLLIPTESLKTFLTSETEATVESIARHFAVPESVVHTKIKNILIL